MRDTSLKAYQQLTHLSDKQQTVLVYIHGHPDTTDKEIAQSLGWEINRVTPRRGELENLGLIVSSGYLVQANKRRAHTWRIKQ
jgi:DNA-binding MarR family transcriptional regulator